MIKVDMPAGRVRNRSLKNYAGTRFGRLTAVRLVEREVTENNHIWKFRCDCGVLKDIRIKLVRSGHTASCGCLLRDVLSQQNTTHGLSYMPEYKVWKDMRSRCTNVNRGDYPNYGGRGIKIFYNWNSFIRFFEDMGPRPPGHTLDRIDVNGDYEPSNCRWANARTQANNKRSNVLIEFNGETKTLQQWSDHYGIQRTAAAWRLKQGWPLAEVFNPNDRRRCPD